MKNLPFVSVIVLNFNGKEHLRYCLPSLRVLDYPRDRLEILLVDNGSTDGSLDFVSSQYPEVKIIQNGRNLGFATANNIGAREARGDYIAILNNDTRVDSNWIRGLLEPIREPDVVCTSSKILSWDGKTIDFVGGVLNFCGHAWQIDQGAPTSEAYDRERPLLFACGGSMLIDRSIFLEVGGFDDDYFIYFEDVDLGWRLNLFGYRVVFAPRAITYHRHTGTTRAFPSAQKLLLYERNALYTIYKNYHQKNLEKILPVALLLALKRGWAYSSIDADPYYLGSGKARFKRAEKISRLTTAHLLALEQFTDNLEKLKAKRAHVQARRRRGDEELFTLFGDPFRAHELGKEYEQALTELSTYFSIRSLFPAG